MSSSEGNSEEKKEKIEKDPITGFYNDPNEYFSEDPEDVERKGWHYRLRRTTRGNIFATEGNLYLILTNHSAWRGRLEFNVRSRTANWRRPPPWEAPDSSPRELSDVDFIRTCEWLDVKMSVGFRSGAVASVLVAIAKEQTFDPVHEYLTNLKWDGISRVDYWLMEYAGVSYSEYVVSVGRAWLISAVARTFQPGCQADYILVFEGEQGIGKSKLIRGLGGEEWTVRITIDPTSKDSALAMHGPWIVEWAELDGLSRRESTAVKSFIDRGWDWLRPPYGRTHVNLARRSILAGSTNEHVYLADPTGGRRYWPVRATECDVESLIRDRDQIWAEAVELYQSGEKWWLDREEEQSAKDEQSLRETDEPWIEMIANALDDSDEEVTTAQVLSMIELDAGQQNPGHGRRIARAMQALGWERIRKTVDGRRLRAYRRPGKRS